MKNELSKSIYDIGINWSKVKLLADYFPKASELEAHFGTPLRKFPHGNYTNSQYDDYDFGTYAIEDQIVKVEIRDNSKVSLLGAKKGDNILDTMKMVYQKFMDEGLGISWSKWYKSASGLITIKIESLGESFVCSTQFSKPDTFIYFGIGIGGTFIKTQTLISSAVQKGDYSPPFPNTF